MSVFRIPRTPAALVLALVALLVAATSASAFEPPTYSFSFGSEGTGNGQFTSPSGVDLDPSGNVWVADNTASRIQKFDSKGTFLLKAGSAGSGNGQIKSGSKDLAVDSAGNVWVTDRGNNRLEKFNSAGEYVSQFGSEGSGNGQFKSPNGIDIDPAGNLWVVDTGNDRVQQFNSKGEFVSKFGSSGSGPGQFGTPMGITVDSDNNVWVVDWTQSRIEKFDRYGQFLAEFGKVGNKTGEFIDPNAIAVDPDSNLWVPDAGSRVQEILPEGEYATKFGSAGSGAGQIANQVYGIVADSSGNLWVADSGNKRVQKWTRPTIPPVSTGAATKLTRFSTTLTGAVNPQGKSTSYQFEYGLTTSFGNVIPSPAKAIGSGSSSVSVKESLTGLKAGTTYYYRVVASTTEGKVNGVTRHFSTAPPPGGSASWHAGGNTFADLGIGGNPFDFSGTITMEFPTYTGETISCSEGYWEGTTELTGTNGVTWSMRLVNCHVIGKEAACTFEPAPVSTIKGTATSLSGGSFKLHTAKETCAVYEVIPYTFPSLTVEELGSEAPTLAVNMSGTGKYGLHSIIYHGSSTWSLIGLLNGQPLGYW